MATRHNVLLTQFDGERPVQVGNGEFAFGMDITGLQTFAPFNTMSHWGWDFPMLAMCAARLGRSAQSARAGLSRQWSVDRALGEPEPRAINRFAHPLSLCKSK